MLFSLITVESAMLSQVSPENVGVSSSSPHFGLWGLYFEAYLAAE